MMIIKWVIYRRPGETNGSAAWVTSKGHRGAHGFLTISIKLILIQLKCALKFTAALYPPPPPP